MRLSMLFERALAIAGADAAGPIRDPAGEHRRSKERYRRVALTAASGAVARGTTIAAGFISVPLAMQHLGAERYGMWLTVSSVTTMLLAVDLGIPNAMIQPLAAVVSEGRETAQRIVSSAFFLLSGISAAFLLTFAALYPFINWQAAFNVSSSVAAQEAGTTAAVALLCLTVSVTAGLVTRVNASFQEGAINNFWQTVGNIVGVAALFAATLLNASLPVMVLVLSGVPLLAMLMNGGSLFIVRRSWLRPRLAHFDFQTARSILRSGRSFFGSYVGYGCLLGGASLIIAHGVGPQHVAEFGLPIRIFAVVSMAVGLLVDPLWPAYAEALGRHDRRWVVVTSRRAIALAALIGVAGSAAVMMSGSTLLRLWVGSLVTTDFMVWAGLAMWNVLACIGLALSALLWGIGAAKFEATMRVAQVVIALLLMTALTPRLGVAGCAWALAISEFARLLPSAAFVARSVRKLEVDSATVLDASAVHSSPVFRA